MYAFARGIAQFSGTISAFKKEKTPLLQNSDSDCDE